MLNRLSFFLFGRFIYEPSTNHLRPRPHDDEDFRITIDNFSDTKATDVSQYSNLKALTLAFYEDSHEVFKPTQLQGDAHFGNFSLNLPWALTPWWCWVTAATRGMS